MTARPKVYLGGPMVFYPDPDATFDAMKRICARHRLEGVAPIDNQIALRGVKPGKTLIRAIVAADIALMDRLDGALFCLDGFRRAPDMDPGTAFEVGYMTARGKPSCGWTGDGRSYPVKVADYFKSVFGGSLHDAKANATGGTSGGKRDPDGILVHSQGCVQNGMVHVGIELGGGRVFADRDWRVAFDRAATRLAKMLGGAL
ncbi:MAG: nucleoside 2-deoxyribosyltransferase [Stellaceae bacterium]